VPDPGQLAKARAAFGTTGRTIGVHISARRPAQRWPAERFAALIQRLQQRDPHAKIALLWSPGPRNDPRHPGDDDKAGEIIGAVGSGTRLVAYPTAKLQQLIGALAACDAVICSDGGAAHLAAALARPTVCFFGDSPAERWRPWGVPLRLLQPASWKVADITVEEAVAAFASLAAVTGVFRNPGA
jgi:ADP-heptose:LPS heptosyltransferase